MSEKRLARCYLRVKVLGLLLIHYQGMSVRSAARLDLFLPEVPAINHGWLITAQIIFQLGIIPAEGYLVIQNCIALLIHI
jgi:hypothetical protein